MGKLVKLKVLIVGLRGLGVETAQNIILAGPASVTLYDPTIARVNDGVKLLPNSGPYRQIN